jgi:hydroxymethylglutaryl-CoA lyase
MKKNYPKKVTLIEVGPRDGLQFEARALPTETKLEIIERLADAGLKHIQVTSFVNPARVPQMADAEQLIRRLPEAIRVEYSGLVLNPQGVERAYHCGLKHVEISISASDTHSRKNTGTTLAQAQKMGLEMIRLARGYNLTIRAGIQCAFGCVDEGPIPTQRVLKIASSFLDCGIDALALSDTTGMGHPASVGSLLELLLPETDKLPVIMHFHDTRGLGLVNVMTSLDFDITRFDTALGGMGGCPFVRGAAGNIATEDTAHLMAELDIETGIDISKVAECSKQLEQYFGKAFSGKLHRIS